ncbi:MAG: hypothetical protein OXN16_13290 [Gammaproteobacteria bacterium]|nr:hypothetical protein [Gammaproteobacteria bacterium]
MSVLAHVVLNGPMGSEPAATQAFAHILDSSPDIARAFLGILSEAEIRFEPGLIQPESGSEDGDGRPDLTIQDQDGQVRLYVENKFWAGLTPDQPVGYLKGLPEDPPAALLFIVPRQRVTTVWNALKLSCVEANLEWQDCTDDSVTHAVTWSRVGRKTLLITSWGHVLDRLLDAASSGEHDRIRRDILQLRDLTDSEDSKAFLPIRPDEVTDQKTARRLVNYCNLIGKVLDKLSNDESDVIRKLGHGSYTHGIGRYLKAHDRFEAWLGIPFDVWPDAGITPLWWRSSSNYPSSGVLGHLQIIRGHFNEAQYHEGTGNLFIPIRLQTGVEEDWVAQEAAEQIRGIADKLQELIPIA